MIVLDENIDAPNRQCLADWGIRFRHIGREIGQTGMADQEVIRCLHRLDHPTFFTLDNDFKDAKLCHAGHCVVFLRVDKSMAAHTIRRILKHPEFDNRSEKNGRGRRSFERGN